MQSNDADVQGSGRGAAPTIPHVLALDKRWGATSHYCLHDHSRDQQGQANDGFGLGELPYLLQPGKTGGGARVKRGVPLHAHVLHDTIRLNGYG